jgi:ribA/ribD-fused uncharacterized protein
MTKWPLNSALIYRTREQFGELSNMAAMPVTHGGLFYPSSEALYQCAKFVDAPDVCDEIRAAPTPKEAKQVARSHLTPERMERFLPLRIPVMEECLRVKLDQHYSRITRVLDHTEDRPIVEKSYHDDFWGAKPSDECLRGTNVLGLLWMKLREDLHGGKELFSEMTAFLPHK